MYSNKIQESTTILNVRTKMSGNLLKIPRIYICVCVCVWFGLVWFYGILTLVYYLMSNLIYIYFDLATLALHLFVILPGYVLRTSINLIKENGLKLQNNSPHQKARSERYSQKLLYMQTMLLANTPATAESLLHSSEQAVGCISFYLNTNKAEYIFQMRRHLHSKWLASRIRRQAHISR